MSDTTLIILIVFLVVSLFSAILMIKNYAKKTDFNKPQEAKTQDTSTPIKEEKNSMLKEDGTYKSNSERLIEVMSDLIPEERKKEIEEEKQEYKKNKANHKTDEGNMGWLNKALE